MNDNSITPTPSVQAKSTSYHLQIILKKLIATAEPSDQIPNATFTISKGRQLFESTKGLVLSWDQQKCANLNNQRLNFVVPNYSVNKYEQFALKMSRKGVEEQTTIGEYLLDCNNFIDHFNESQNGAFQQVMKIGEKYQLETQIYVGNNRVAVEKLIRDIQNPKKSSIYQLQTIEERSEQVKSKYLLMPKENRFRRAPSPMRREIQEVITRRQSPRKDRNELSRERSNIEKQERQKVEKQNTGKQNDGNSFVPNVKEEIKENNVQIKIQEEQIIPIDHTTKRNSEDAGPKIKKTESNIQIVPEQKVEQKKPSSSLFKRYFRKIKRNPKMFAFVLAFIIFFVISLWPSSEQPVAKDPINVKKASKAKPQKLKSSQKSKATKK